MMQGDLLGRVDVFYGSISAIKWGDNKIAVVHNFRYGRTTTHAGYQSFFASNYSVKAELNSLEKFVTNGIAIAKHGFRK